MGTVAPFTGAWIEIVISSRHFLVASVAPFTGAWIEIMISLILQIIRVVAPFTGAWIEIFCVAITIASRSCRSLHGGVD